MGMVQGMHDVKPTESRCLSIFGKANIPLPPAPSPSETLPGNRKIRQICIREKDSPIYLVFICYLNVGNPKPSELHKIPRTVRTSHSFIETALFLFCLCIFSVRPHSSRGYRRYGLYHRVYKRNIWIREGRIRFE